MSEALSMPLPSLADVPFLVVNPASGAGATGRRWAALEREARTVLSTFEVALTTRQGEATEITRRALLAGHRTIVAVGGDGTINEVVNGFFHEDGSPVAPGAAFSVLPRGTGGDFKRVTDVPKGWAAAVRHIATAPVRQIDVGRVRFVAHGGAQGLRHFVNVGSLGVPGAVDAEVQKGGKWLGGRISFMLATLKALWGWRDCLVRMSVDGGPSEEVRLTSLAMGNGQYFGGGMRVAPQAQLDDGLFHCTLWKGYTVWDFVVRAAGVYSGAHVGWTKTRTFTASRVEVHGDGPILLDLDGEQPGVLPATFEILPGAIGLKA